MLAHRSSSSSALKETLIPEDHLAAIVERVRGLAGVSSAAIALTTDNAGEIECRARSGPMAPEIGVSVIANGSLTAECIRSARQIYVCDPQNDPRLQGSLVFELGVRSSVITPIVRESRVRGVVIALSNAIQGFKPSHLSQLQIVCQEIAGVLWAGPKPDESEVELTPEALSVLSRSLDLTPVDVVQAESVTVETIQSETIAAEVIQIEATQVEAAPFNAISEAALIEVKPAVQPEPECAPAPVAPATKLNLTDAAALDKIEQASIDANAAANNKVEQAPLDKVESGPQFELVAPPADSPTSPVKPLAPAAQLIEPVRVDSLALPSFAATQTETESPINWVMGHRYWIGGALLLLFIGTAIWGFLASPGDDDERAKPSTARVQPPKTSQVSANGAEVKPSPRLDSDISSGPPAIKIQSSTPAPRQGATFSLDVVFSHGREIASVPMQVNYDPTALRFVSVSDGEFFSTSGQKVGLAQRDDSTHGTLKINLQLPAGASVSGDGTVCRLVFVAMEKGSSKISVAVNARNSHDKLLSFASKTAVTVN